MKYLLMASLAFCIGGCSRALPFSFQFASDTDLAAANSVDLSVAQHLDLATSTTDLAAPSADLASADLAIAPMDLSGDLTTTPSGDLFSADLRPQLDLRPLGNPIGGACENPNQCAAGLTCISTVGGVTFPSGFCTKACVPPSNSTSDPCGDGNACVLGFYNNDMAQTLCAPRCNVVSMCRLNYTCCPDAVTIGQPVVCLPAAAPYCQ